VPLLARADPADFVRRHTTVAAPPLVPELRLHLGAGVTPLWHAAAAHHAGAGDATAGQEPPFWAYAWPGSQALARWILDNPAVAAGRQVLDVGAGSGLAAIAAAKVGAVAIANDVDPLAAVAAALNAELNGVTVGTSTADLVDVSGDGGLLEADLVLVGDLCYDRALAERMMAWLRRLARTRVVVLADPDRPYVPRAGLRELVTHRVPTLPDLESRPERATTLFAVLPE
jgi:predicted nicotinamide N-methyase